MALATDDTSRAFETLRPVVGTMLGLEALADFILVASHGGIAQASRSGGRPKASFAQAMELEAGLGVRLFERGSPSVHPTEKGEMPTPGRRV